MHSDYTGLVNTDPNNVELRDDIVDDDLNNVRLVKFTAWCNRYKQCKGCKR